MKPVQREKLKLKQHKHAEVVMLLVKHVKVLKIYK